MDQVLKVDIAGGFAFLKRIAGDFWKEGEIEVLLLPLLVNRFSEILKKGIHTLELFRSLILATRTIPISQIVLS